MTLLTGELRPLPPALWLRALQALSLYALARAVVRLFARFALGYRHVFTLEAEGRQLVLSHQKRVFGRTLVEFRSVLLLDRVRQITWEKAGASPLFFVGLSALAVGTFVGSRFMMEGVRAPGGAPWLLSAGALLITSGLALDFFVGSGRTYHKPLRGHAQISLDLDGEKGWVLSHLDERDALTLIQLVERALATGQGLESVPRGSAEGESPSAPPS